MRNGALGGRAAEQLVYGTGTTGAENDLKQVTEVARGMVTRWGMSREIGLISLDATAEGDFLGQGFNGNGGRRHSEATERAVDAAIRRIVDECYEKALELLGQERARLDARVEALLREESLDEGRIRAVVELPEPVVAATSAAP